MSVVKIYILKDPTTGDVRYVGLTRFPVKRLHNEINYPHTVHLRNWVESLKRSKLRPQMEIVEDVDEELSGEAERRWIAHYKANGARLINFTDGGERGYRCTEEYRRALSLALTGKKRGPMSAAHRAAIAAGNRGKKRPYVSARLAVFNKSRSGIPLSDEHKAVLSAAVKRAMTPEVRARMSISRQGKRAYIQTKETKAKTAESLRKWHAEHKQEFTETIRRRGNHVANDPKSGRFVRKS